MIAGPGYKVDTELQASGSRPDNPLPTGARVVLAECRPRSHGSCQALSPTLTLPSQWKDVVPQLSRMPPFLGGFPRQRTQGCILSFWVNLLFRTITVKVQPSVSMATVRATWEIPPGSLKRDNPATTLNCPSVLVLVVITMEWTGWGALHRPHPMLASPNAGSTQSFS